MDPIEPYTRVTLNVLIIASAVLDIACFKWRHLASLLIYLECLTRVVAIFIPNFASYEYNNIGYLMLFGLIYGTFYCDSGR